MIGAVLILVAVRYLGKLLKLLMVGRARDILIKAVGRNAYLAMASGMGVTVVTQSSTITTSVLVPFAGTGILTPAQVFHRRAGWRLGPLTSPCERSPRGSARVITSWLTEPRRSPARPPRPRAPTTSS